MEVGILPGTDHREPVGWMVRIGACEEAKEVLYFDLLIYKFQ